MMKRLLVITSVIIALLSCSLLASCSDDKPDTGGKDITTAAKTKGDADVTADSSSKALGWEDSGVPKVDYDGYEFKIISIAPPTDHEYKWRYLDVEEQNGEPLNDAIYERKRNLEEAFNIKMSVSYTGSPATDIPKSINAGDDDFSVANAILSTQLSFAQNNYLIDFYDLPYINLERSWWDKDFVRDMSINNKLYFATGDISPVMNVRIFSLVFNKDMCKELGFDYPYQLVLDGSWTFDTFTKYVRNVNQDMNGDGVMDYNDRWGFFSETGVTYMMFISGGGRIARLDSDNIPELVMDSERNVNIISKALDISIDKETTLWANDYVEQQGNSWMAASAWYAAGNALIRSSAFEAVPRDYRTMETDFGILPFPKYDEHQDKYYSLAAGHTGYVISVPVTTTDPERTGLLLEAMAAESVTTVSEAFYEISLAGKYVRDDESADMLDIIFGNKIFDLGQTLNLGGFTTQIVNLEKAGNTDIASMYASIKNSAQGTLDNLIKAYTE